MKNPYKILDIEVSASISEIKAAYKSMAQKYHPDKNKDEGAELLFTTINKAYEILIDPVARARYDETGDMNNVDLISKARSALSAGLNSYIRQNIEEGVDDIQFREVVIFFKETLKSNRIDLFKLNSKLKKLDKMKDRVKLKQCDDLYSKVFEDARKSLKGEIKIAETNVEVNEKVMDILEGAIDNGVTAESFVNYLTATSPAYVTTGP